MHSLTLSETSSKLLNPLFRPEEWNSRGEKTAYIIGSIVLGIFTGGIIHLSYAFITRFILPNHQEDIATLIKNLPALNSSLSHLYNNPPQIRIDRTADSYTLIFQTGNNRYRGGSPSSITKISLCTGERYLKIDRRNSQLDSSFFSLASDQSCNAYYRLIAPSNIFEPTTRKALQEGKASFFSNSEITYNHIQDVMAGVRGMIDTVNDCKDKEKSKQAWDSFLNNQTNFKSDFFTKVIF